MRPAVHVLGIQVLPSMPGLIAEPLVDVAVETVMMKTRREKRKRRRRRKKEEVKHNFQKNLTLFTAISWCLTPL